MDSASLTPAQTRLRRYVTIILRWLLITVSVFILTVLAGVSITNHWLQKVYTATAQIELIPKAKYDPSGSESDSVFSDHPTQSEAELIKTQISTMQSPDFLLPVIYNLDLDKEWAVRMSSAKEKQLSPTEAMACMQKLLKIDVVRGTNIVDITASSAVPKEAADIANAIADRYKALRDHEEEHRANAGLDSLRDQIAEQQKVVDDQKTALAKPLHPQATDEAAAQRDLQQQQALLDALHLRLKQVMTDNQLRESPVSIVARATPPEYPSKPNKLFNFLVTLVVAGFLSLAVASFIEIIFLFSRASERTDN